ncbi:MAG: hypothetical protein HYZ50_13095 [Deltaproteobacteria bacterium]|nr:hypothetical protein [Deltaproteobacteria bacterium]
MSLSLREVAIAFEDPTVDLPNDPVRGTAARLWFGVNTKGRAWAANDNWDR